MSLILRRDIDVSVGTSPITPCYDVEQLETKTHVGLGPGESIEYTKHRVRLEGHPWPGCCPEEIPGVHIVMDRPSKKRLEQSWSSEPERLLLKQKGLWPARWGHPGCKTLQMWTARTSQPHKCLKWTPHWPMPKTRWCLWWNGLWLRWGTATQRRSILMWLASTNHLEILCFVTGPPLAWLPKPTKHFLTFCMRQKGPRLKHCNPRASEYSCWKPPCC